MARLLVTQSLSLTWVLQQLALQQVVLQQLGRYGSNLTFFDSNHGVHIGDSWDDGMGNGGSNFRIRLDAALDIDGDTS